MGMVDGCSPGGTILASSLSASRSMAGGGRVAAEAPLD